MENEVQVVVFTPELNEMIAAFLAERRESDGGYAPVTRDDIRQLYDIIYKLIELKWENDPDGDGPMSAKLIDHTKGHMSYFQPIPHKDDVAAFQIAVSNLHVASEDMRRQIDLRRLNDQYIPKPLNEFELTEYRPAYARPQDFWINDQELLFLRDDQFVLATSTDEFIVKVERVGPGQIKISPSSEWVVKKAKFLFDRIKHFVEDDSEFELVVVNEFE